MNDCLGGVELIEDVKAARNMRFSGDKIENCVTVGDACNLIVYRLCPDFRHLRVFDPLPEPFSVFGLP